MSLEEKMKSVAEDIDLLRELERQNIDEIRKLRAHERLEIRIGIVVQPANSSQVDTLRIEGESKDISNGGCMGVFTAPVGVGDVFRLTFDRAKLDLPMVFARCLRCRLLREDAFEAAFAFFTPMTLSSGPAKDAKDLLA